MKIFYATEFIEHGRAIDLLSIGMVTDDGREYYAVNNNGTHITRAIQHPWLRWNVVPHLPIRIIDGDGSWTYDPQHPDWRYMKPITTIATEVCNFIRTTPDPQLWAWYGAYDHVAYAQLYGSMAMLPSRLPMFTCDLKQEAVRLGDPRVPEQEKGQHNALEDARHNRVIAQFLAEYAAKAGA